jgi:hypothetical protein
MYVGTGSEERSHKSPCVTEGDERQQERHESVLDRVGQTCELVWTDSGPAPRAERMFDGKTVPGREVMLQHLIRDRR